MEKRLNLEEIRAAQKRIQPYAKRTPLLRAEALDERLGCTAYLKPEMLQLTGSFKLRGALNRALTLTDGEKAKGMIASSSGNHAQGLAYAGRLIGAKTVIVVPHTAPKFKIERTRSLGAQVIVFEGSQEARWAYTYEQAEKHGYTMVHAFDETLVMAGQGTIGLEILEDLPEINTVVVPLGGGGLISGIATALKESNSRIRTVGVEPELAPVYLVSRQNGAPTKVPAGDTIADGVKSGIYGEHAYPVIERYVDEIALAGEVSIIEALRTLALDAKLFAEGAAAVGLGAALSGQIKFAPQERVCFVLTGGNWELERFFAAVNGQKEV